MAASDQAAAAGPLSSPAAAAGGGGGKGASLTSPKGGKPPSQQGGGDAAAARMDEGLEAPAELQGAGGEFEYVLFSVICHKGDITGGHYVAYVRCCGAWFCCDDAWVTLVEEREVAQAQAYMLFYTQRRFADDAGLLRLVGLPPGGGGGGAGGQQGGRQA